MYLVPFLKYPANPPAVGNDETIAAAQRALPAHGGVLACCSWPAAVWLGQRLRAAVRQLERRRCSPALAFVVAIGVVMVLLPPLGALAANAGESATTLTETPLPLTDPTGAIVFPGFPADVLYWFRLYSVIAQALLWAAIGVVVRAAGRAAARPVGRRRQAGDPRGLIDARRTT